jgi:hypothetical protein
MIHYIADTEHYSEVISRIPKVKRLLWIATADLKGSSRWWTFILTAFTYSPSPFSFHLWLPNNIYPFIGAPENLWFFGRAEASVALTTTWSLVNAIRLPNASVKCQVSSRCDLFCAKWYTLFCPYRLTTVFSGRVSSCIFILNFRAHAHYSISISIDFTLDTLHYK